MRKLIRQLKSFIFYTAIVIFLLAILIASPVLSHIEKFNPSDWVYSAILISIILLGARIKGRGHRIVDGYIFLTKENEFEHRHIAKQRLKRSLRPNEVVHHINGKKTDNAPANLCVMDRQRHEMFHSWLSWKRNKLGYYPQQNHQKAILIKYYGGTLLEKVNTRQSEKFAFRMKAIKKSPEFSEESDQLYKDLKRLRLQLSIEQNIRPYEVFKNFTLEAMVSSLPENYQMMLQLPGMSDEKLRQYGDCFLNVVRSHKRETQNLKKFQFK